MKSPLLSNNVEEDRRKNSFLIIFIIFLTLFTIAFCHHQFVSLKSTSESDVGMPVDRLHLLRTYFTLGGLPDEMRLHQNYLGPSTNIVDRRFCLIPGTRTCDEICQDRVAGRANSDYFCKSQKISPETGSIECWETRDMRCWNLDSSVHDGIQEWDIMSQDLTGALGVPWVHFASRTIPVRRFIVFGRGQIRPYATIAEIMRTFQESPLFVQLRSVSMDTLVVLGGHSEGAAWAACLNIFLSRKLGRPASSRYVIGTGTPLADLKFHRIWEEVADAGETSTFLLSAVRETTAERRLLTDVLMAQQSTEPFAKTFPQHAFACTPDTNGRIKCEDPQPTLFSMTNTIQSAQQGRDDTLLQTLHDFETYQLCFFKCEGYFARNGVTFEPNVEEFQIQPPYTNLHPSLQQSQVQAQPSLGSGQAPYIPSISPTKSPQAEAGPSQKVHAQLPPESSPERSALESLLLLDPGSSIEGQEENDTTGVSAKVRGILKVVLLMLKPMKGESLTLFTDRVVQEVRIRLREALSPTQKTNYAFWMRNWFNTEVTRAYYNA